MIRSKPKRSTLFSLSLFLVLTYGAGIWAWIRIPDSPAIWFLLPVLCFVVALAVSVKVLTGYRVVQISGDNWLVKRLLSRNRQFSSKDIEWWKEIEINTAGGMYKQLHVHAGKGNDAKVSLQEHTEYQNVLNRLRTKHRKQQVKEPG